MSTSNKSTAGKSADAKKRRHDDGDEDMSAIPLKKGKKAAEKEGVGRLAEFEEKGHWTTDTVISTLGEPARGVATTRDLLLVQLFTSTARGGKIGTIELTTLEGMGRYLITEFSLQNLTIMTMACSSTHGAKYLLDVTDVKPEVLKGLPYQVTKLGHGVGLEVTRLGDPRQGILMTASYPPWAALPELKAALLALPWVKNVERLKRSRICEGKVETNRVTFWITQKPGVEVKNVTMAGGGVTTPTTMVADLFTSPRWTITLSFGGYKVHVNRAPSCSYCGYDSHLQADCNALLKMTSDSTVTYVSKVAEKKAGAPTRARTPDNKMAPTIPESSRKAKKAKKQRKVKT